MSKPSFVSPSLLSARRLNSHVWMTVYIFFINHVFFFLKMNKKNVCFDNQQTKLTASRPVVMKNKNYSLSICVNRILSAVVSSCVQKKERKNNLPPRNLSSWGSIESEHCLYFICSSHLVCISFFFFLKMLLGRLLTTLLLYQLWKVNNKINIDLMNSRRLEKKKIILKRSICDFFALVWFDLNNNLFFLNKLSFIMS